MCDIEVNWAEELHNKVPGLYVVTKKIEKVNNKSRSDKLELLKNSIIEKITKNFTLNELKNNHIIRKYRDFYWSIKIDPTKIRPAGEALARRVLAGKPFPSISPAVDAYNLASLETFIALSGYDLKKLKPPIEIRFSNDGEYFYGIGGKTPKILTGKEIVVSDKDNIICVYPFRDSKLSKIETSTENILLVGYGVPNLEKSLVTEAVEKASKYIKSICQAIK